MDAGESRVMFTSGDVNLDYEIARFDCRLSYHIMVSPQVGSCKVWRNLELCLILYVATCCLDNAQHTLCLKPLLLVFLLHLWYAINPIFFISEGVE